MAEPNSPSGKSDFSLQVKEIIEALHDIRSQLAEQNKYLDVLTETYVKKPAEIEFEDEWKSEFEGDETLNVEFADFDLGEEMKDGVEIDFGDSEHELEKNNEEDEFHEVENEIAPEAATDKAMEVAEWAKDLSTLPGRYPDEPHIVDMNRYTQSVTATTMFYLPMGIVSSFFAMNRFSPKSGNNSPSQNSFNTLFVVLLLAVYIFAACALWFAREEGWMRELLTSWVPTKTATQSKRSTASTGAAGSRSGFPRPLRRRAWEPAI